MPPGRRRRSESSSSAPSTRTASWPSNWSGIFAQRGIAAQLPVWKGAPEKVRTALEYFLSTCDGFLVVHGDNPVWPNSQWNYYVKKVRPRRESPLKAFGLCEAPPPDKPPCGLRVPGAHEIDCRDRFAEDRFERFLQALLLPGPAA